MLGSNLGAAGGCALAASMGLPGTAAAALALTGGLAGRIIAGLALTLAIQNWIEKPYMDLLNNTRACREATAELGRLSQTVLKGQSIFGKFLEADYFMDMQFQNQLARIDAAGQRAKDAINKIKRA